MSLTTEPTEIVSWAENISNNSPSGNPNREAYDIRFSELGWLYGEKPPYATLNQWMYGMFQWKDWLEINLTAVDADTSAAIGSLDDRVTVLEGTPVPASIKVFNSGYQAVTNGTLYNFDHNQNTKNMVWTVYGSTNASGANETVVHDQEWTEDWGRAQGYMIKVDTSNRINIITAEHGYMFLSDIGKGGSPSSGSSQRRNWQYMRVVGIGF